MSPAQMAFLTFVQTGTLGIIDPAMDLTTVNTLLPGCDYRTDPPSAFLIGTHIEITFEENRMVQVRVRFITYATESWTVEVAPWFLWLQAAPMEHIEQLLQDQKIGYRRLLLFDDASIIEFVHVPIRLLYDEHQQIDKVFRLYEGLHPLDTGVVIETKTFPAAAGDGAM